MMNHKNDTPSHSLLFILPENILARLLADNKVAAAAKNTHAVKQQNPHAALI